MTDDNVRAWWNRHIAPDTGIAMPFRRQQDRAP